MSALPRRRKIGRRRRVEDEGDDDGRLDTADLEDDSLTDGSISDDNEGAEDSDTSNIDEASPTSLNAGKSSKAAKPAKPANGAAQSSVSAAKTSVAKKDISQDTNTTAIKQGSDTDMMLHGLSITEQPELPQEMHFDDAVSPPKSPSAPVVVSSAMRQQPASHVERRKQEHEDYKKRRDEDPAFVPNRGTFFMHDHRHAGPAANGFRPFGRGRGRGGRYGVGGPFAPFRYAFQLLHINTVRSL